MIGERGQRGHDGKRGEDGRQGDEGPRGEGGEAGPGCDEEELEEMVERNAEMEEEFEETFRDQELLEEEYKTLEASHEEIQHLLYKFMGGLNFIFVFKFVMYLLSLFKVKTSHCVFETNIQQL